MTLYSVLFVFLVFCIFMLMIGIIDGNRFRTIEETVVLDKITKNFKFVLISDLHNKVYGKNNEKIVAEIKKANPDFIIIAGDLVTSHVKESTKPGVNLVQQLSKQYDIYYALGNHETRMRVDTDAFHDQYTQFIEQIDHDKMHLLVNQSMDIPQYNIKIFGLELERFYFSKFKKRKLTKDKLCSYIGESDPKKCNVLIAHHPDYFEEYENWGADFVLSGHVHGGIMRLPLLGGVISPSYCIFPKYDGGIFKINEATMLLGRGMGAHTIPLRFFNPAELYIVNCLRK